LVTLIVRQTGGGNQTHENYCENDAHDAIPFAEHMLVNAESTYSPFSARNVYGEIDKE
jgi:hypothetical protein